MGNENVRSSVGTTKSTAPPAHFSIVTDVGLLAYNKRIYQALSGMNIEAHQSRFDHWWAWANPNGLNEAEFLMPQIRVQTHRSPFAFERRFIDAGLAAPSQAQIAKLGPWAYQVEFGALSTLARRDVRDYDYHRYRASLLVDTAAAIAGDKRANMSVLDVACHCGVFSLQFAERGFKKVTGLDLRPQNIRQANFLADAFDVPRVEFMEMNARRLSEAPMADVVFCGGLLYHVTFPMELIAGLYLKTKEFLVLDTLTHKYPFSGFHLVCNKDVNYSAEGEFSYEFHPTYRAVCDALYAIGFKVVYELIGSGAADAPNYDTTNVRSFVAAKTEGGALTRFVNGLARRSPP